MELPAQAALVDEKGLILSLQKRNAGYHLTVSHTLTVVLAAVAATGLVSAPGGERQYVALPAVYTSLGCGEQATVGGQQSFCKSRQVGDLVALSGGVVGWLQLELANMVQSGEVAEMWMVAKQTDLQFNMVSQAALCVIAYSYGW